MGNSEVKGRRVYPEFLDGKYRLGLRAGDYGKRAEDGHWMVCTPNGMAGDLDLHNVVEHEDRTITVEPSILVTAEYDDPQKKIEWHGFLEHGVWRSC